MAMSHSTPRKKRGDSARTNWGGYVSGKASKIRAIEPWREQPDWQERWAEMNEEYERERSNERT